MVSRRKSARQTGVRRQPILHLRCPAAGAPGQFSVFARVVEGMDVVEQISRVPVDADGLTQKPVRIFKISIEQREGEPFAGVSADELRKTVVMNTTLGAMKLQMQPDWAPNTVRRFLMLFATGWYDGTVSSRRERVRGAGRRGDSRASGRIIRPIAG